MPRNQQPWIKFYYRRWLESEKVWRMSPAGQGLYMRALALQSRDWNIPADPELLALALQIKATDMAAWAEARVHFLEEVVNGETRLYNLKLRQELEATLKKSKKRSEAGFKGGSKTKAIATAKGTQKENKKESSAPLRASLSSSYSKSDSESDFNEFYGLYPLKKKRARALEAWVKKVDSHELALRIIEHLRERVGRDPQWKKGYIEHPTTWINGQQWEDDYMATPEAAPRRGPVRPGEVRNGEMAQHSAPKSAPLSQEEADMFKTENDRYWEEVAAK